MAAEPAADGAEAPEVVVAELPVPGARLHTETRGSGPLLLLVVGGMAEFAAAVGLGPLAAPASRPELAPLLDRVAENRRFWFAHEFRRYPAHPVDIEALAPGRGKDRPHRGRRLRPSGN